MQDPKLHIIGTNILTKYHECQTENKASKVLSMFSNICLNDLLFDQDQFQTFPWCLSPFPNNPWFLWPW